MGHIKQLDAATIQQIAAGEVIERPASVVKELIENAIDAKATRIDIAVQNGGISEIRIQDNGIGIPQSECVLAFSNHATSKLTDINDLHTLMTMGFRGEALASIAAISRVTLISKPREQEHAYKVEFAASKLIKAETAALSDGTQLIVRDLFYNVPARFKFLKKDQGEVQAITRIVTEEALAAPNVAFTLSSNNKLLLQTPGNNDLLSAVQALFGSDVADALVPIYGDDNYNLVCKGFVARANLSRKSRRMEYFFINKRAFNSSVVTKALEAAMQPYLMTRTFPVAFLFLNLPPNLVDVNVHPRKLEVRFWNDNEVYRSVYYQVRQAMAESFEKASSELYSVNAQIANAEQVAEPMQAYETPKQATSQGTKQTKATQEAEIIDKAPIKNVQAKPSLERISTFSKVEVGKRQPNLANSQAEVIMPNYAQNLAVKTPNLGNTPVTTQIDNASIKAPQTEANKAPSSQAQLSLHEPLTNYHVTHSETNSEIDANSKLNTNLTSNYTQAKAEITLPNLASTELKRIDGNFAELNKLSTADYLGQLHGTYLLFNVPDCLLIVDQHAMHERINYELLLKAQATPNKQANCQQLLVPYEFSLPVTEAILLKDNLTLLAENGYQLEAKSTTEFALLTVNTTDVQADFARLISEFISDLSEQTWQQTENKLAKKERLIARRACRSSIMANDYVAPELIQKLIPQLLACQNPFQCPHGRPTCLQITRLNIEKAFKRKL